MAGCSRAANAVGEFDELTAECLVVGDDLVTHPAVGGARLSPLDNQAARHVAQKRRWQLERQALIRGVETELLAVPGNPWEIDP